jgi:hypothetical protein
VKLRPFESQVSVHPTQVQTGEPLLGSSDWFRCRDLSPLRSEASSSSQAKNTPKSFRSGKFSDLKFENFSLPKIGFPPD